MAPHHSSDSSSSNRTHLINSQIQDVTNEDEEIRRQAIRSLGQLGSEACTALPALRKALTSTDFITRLEAAIAIGFIGTKEETEYLLPLLDDEEEAVRFQTISALAFLKDSRATPELLHRYDNETIHVQDQILRALGHLGGADAYDLLERELKAQHSTVRTGAVVGLSFLGDQRAFPLLKEVAETDSDEIVAHEAKIALLQLQKTSRQDAKN
ncbi:MAG: HEAT repeat domain-containing protein [Promethearchaeota archaeon]